MSRLHTSKALLWGLLPLILAISGCSSSGVATTPSAPTEPVLATFGTEQFTVSQFEERFSRASGSREAAADSSQEAYADFLSRFVDYRLKVLAGREAGLDAHPDVVSEIEQYRTNLARPYLLEQTVIDPLVRFLYERQREVVDASHILMQVAPNAPANDTLAAYNRLVAALDSVRAGMPFGTAAERFSEDPSARSQGPGSQGRLGYFTAGDMVDEFEDFAYSTPVGEFSPIFRTRFGYHAMFVHDRRPTPADIRVAHIMVTPPGEEQGHQDFARLRLEGFIDSVRAGVPFEELAANFSDDPGSGGRGGDLGWIPFSAPIVEPFKSTAFGLTEPGQLSEVIQTQFGYHLIKLLERRERPTFEQAYNDLKNLASRSQRAQNAQNRLADDVLTAQNATFDIPYLTRVFVETPYDSLMARMARGTVEGVDYARPLVSFADSVYTFGDVQSFMRTQRVAREENPVTMAEKVLRDMARTKAIDFEASRLESRDPAFAALMNEFRDGLVLFKLMEDSVWTAAQNDSLGLQRHFEANASRYVFPDRHRIVSLTSSSDSLLTELAQHITEGRLTFSGIAEHLGEQSGMVRVDTAFVSGTSGSIFDRAVVRQPGEFVGPLSHRGQRIVLFNDGIEPSRAKTFAEARAEVISEYQQVLEGSLMQRLRARYNVQMRPENLVHVFQSAP